MATAPTVSPTLKKNAPCMPWPWWKLQWNSVAPDDGIVTGTSTGGSPGCSVSLMLSAALVKVCGLVPTFEIFSVTVWPDFTLMNDGPKEKSSSSTSIEPLVASPVVGSFTVPGSDTGAAAADAPEDAFPVVAVFVSLPHPTSTRPMAHTMTEMRTMIFAMTGPTDGESPGIGDPGPDRVRRYGVWDASDEALVAGLAAGDADAALVFVRRFQRRVFGAALLVVNDAGRAEDVAQEVFVRAWRHADNYDARRASVTTWLLTITRNLAIDSLRVERVRPADPSAAVELGVDLRAGPAERAEVTDDVARVAAALQDLPAEQRRALLLASLHGRTAKEISEIEAIPLGTAKTRIRTALHHVRHQLATERPT